jgi:hypothetical protein
LTFNILRLSSIGGPLHLKQYLILAWPLSLILKFEEDTIIGYSDISHFQDRR